MPQKSEQKIIQYNPLAGESVEQACNGALELSKEKKAPVQLNFNSAKILVTPRSRVRALLVRLEKANQKLVKRDRLK